MPKIHLIGRPIDLYRYKTFLEVLIEEKEEWGVSLNYNSHSGDYKKTPLFVRKFKSFFNLLQSIYNIWTADFIYYPALVLQPSLYHKIMMKSCDFFRKRVIFEFYLSLYDTYVLDRKIFKTNSKKALQLKKYDQWGHTRYRTIYLNQCEAKRYRSINNLSIDKNSIIIPLSISPRPFAQLNYFKNGNSGIFNLIWWGTYIPLHGLDKIIEAIKILISQNVNIHLYILGNDKEKSKEYRSIVCNSKDIKDHITISDDKTFSNGELLPFLIKHCDLAFGAFGSSDKAKTVILNKAIEAIAMKIPVITQYSEAFQEYFDPESSLFYCSNDPQSIAYKIMEIMGIEYGDLQMRLDTAYKIYKDIFSIEASKMMFKKMLKTLAEECQSSQN